MSSNRRTNKTPDDLLLERFSVADEARFRGDTDWATSSLADLPSAASSKLNGMLECLELLAAAGHSESVQRKSDSAIATEPRKASVFGAAEPGIPQEYAGYQIEQLLGRGGFGVVYKAWNEQLRRTAAIKIPLPQVIASDSALQRFEVEARASAALQHPNIVIVHDAATGAQPAIVYEYCDGGTLTSFSKANDGPLRERLIFDIAISIAGALRHAHSRGVLHRDLKPSNILLKRATDAERADGFRVSDDWWIPKLCDFGLARIVNEASDATQTDMIMGSVNYMAPEQASGNSKASGTFTDVFSFGSVLYWMITGMPPFKADTRIISLLRLETQDPIPPRNLRPEISKDLQSVCLKCLQKRPQDRYESFADIRDDLLAIRNGEPISLQPASATQRFRAWCRNHRTMAVSLVLVCVLVCTGFAVQALHNAAQQRLITKLDITNTRLKSAIGREQQARLDVEAREQQVQHLYYTAELRNAANLIELGRNEEARQRLTAHTTDERSKNSHGFAFRFLLSSCTEPLHILTEHQHEVLSSALAADRGILATGDKQGTIFIRAADNGQVKRSLDPFPGEVCDLKFSPDENWLAACGSGGLIHIYDTSDWKIMQVLAGHKMTVKSLAFTLDGRQLISGSRDHHIVFWNTETWKEQRRIKAHDTVQDISLSGDGRWLASGGSDGHTKVWNVESAEMVLDVKGHDDTVLATAISSDGRFVASGGYEHYVCVWEQSSGKLIARIENNAQAWALSFLSSGEHLAIGTSAGDVRTIRVAEDKAPQRIRDVQCHESRVRSIIYLDTPPRLITTSDDRHVCITSEPIGGLTTTQTTERAHGFAFGPDGKTLAIGQDNGLVTLYDRSGKAMHSRKIPVDNEASDGYPRVAFRDTDTLCSASIHGMHVRLEFLSDVNETDEKLLPHEKPVVGVSFSHDGSLLAGFGNDFVTVWDTTTGTQVATCAAPLWINNVSFSASGRLLAIVTDHGDVVVRNLFEGTSTELPSPLRNGIYAAAFDSSGRFLAAGGFDRIACIWNLETPDIVAKLPLPAATRTLSFSPDGGLLAVGSNDIRLFDVNSKERLLTFGAITDSDFPYTFLEFSPGNDGLAAVYDTPEVSKLSIWSTTDQTIR